MIGDDAFKALGSGFSIYSAAIISTINNSYNPVNYEVIIYELLGEIICILDFKKKFASRPDPLSPFT